MKVLVVDDDGVSLRLLIALVEKLGHQAISASDGMSAWELYREHHCRVVISDWNMPGLDGIELLTRIRTLGSGSYTYFIMLTARSEREDVSVGMAAGADDLLIKPVSRDDLAARLNVAQRIVALQEQIENRSEELLLANERMRQDLQAAVKVQAALLPTVMPQIPGLDFAWLYRPCDHLGGDTLNLFRLDENHIGFYVLDVSGHGVSSALLAVQASRFLSPLITAGALLKKADANPSGYRLAAPIEVMRELNHLFPMTEATMQYFTIIYGIYHLPTHELRLAAAGHPGPILLQRGGGYASPDLSSNPIGFFSTGEALFAEFTMRLEPGERVYFFSDGAVETMSPAEEILGTDRLAAALSRARGAALAVSLDQVVDVLGQWRGGQLPTDDVTVLAIERKA